MNYIFNADTDLMITRVIKAPRARVWEAWAKPALFEQWWIPAPMTLKVQEMNLCAGGSFVTEMSENGQSFMPHLSACFLDVIDQERIVFSDTLLGGWRPSDRSFLSFTAIITFKEHPDGMEYTSFAMHKARAEKEKHEELGFYDGWGTVIGQLAALVEK
jgi:uncharacterized protein YndB with AHSA1/START domain